MAAKGYKSAAQWLEEAAVPVVDDAEQSIAKNSQSTDEAAAEKNVSLHLSALDPDLANLLSPNHFNSNSTISPDPTSAPRSLNRSDRRASSISQKPSIISSPHRKDSTTAQSSPIRRSFLSPSSRIPSSSSLPRLRSAASNQSTPLRADKDLPLLPPVSIYPETQNSDSAIRQGLFDIHRPRASPPSPPSPGTASNASWTATYRKPTPSRLATPTRHATYLSAGNKRPRFRPALNVSPPQVDDEPASPPPPASSSLGTSASSRLLHNLRSSLDSDRPHLLRSRKRSMSLDVQRMSPGFAPSQHARPPYMRPSSSLSNARPSPEWLGPRTARAFAAAGLLDNDKDSSGNLNRSTSRAGLARSGSDRNTRSQRAPSRIALSEASGSNSSWGRSGSVCYTMTASEPGGGLIESPTFSPITPRTNFSGGSTAPTSVSAVSSAQLSLQNTVQMMKERHDLETEALLAALSDSQRTTKVLREENSELRQRIQILEDQLGETRHLLLRYRSASSTPLPRPIPGASSFESRSRADSTNGDLRQHLELYLQLPKSNPPPSPHALITRPQEHQDPSLATSAFDLPPKTQVRRSSTTSSVFPNPPSNMTMLMTEESVMPDRSAAFSSRSISPSTSVVPLSARIKHTHKRSMSSGGNISPTTANFSMTEMTGSPGSLFLRPEHERHLGDMVSLDLGYNLSEGVDGDGGS
jgi:hypothetical protein